MKHTQTNKGTRTGPHTRYRHKQTYRDTHTHQTHTQAHTQTDTNSHTDTHTPDTQTDTLHLFISALSVIGGAFGVDQRDSDCSQGGESEEIWAAFRVSALARPDWEACCVSCIQCSAKCVPECSKSRRMFWGNASDNALLCILVLTKRRRKKKTSLGKMF